MYSISAAVIGALKAINQLKLKKHVIFAVAVAENAINEKSYKPHAIIKSKKGNVQVGNTDAEGRLALADTLSYVQSTYKPNIIIDLATLTGACVVGLGEYTAGLFSNDDKLAKIIINSGNAINQQCWRLPILKEHIDDIKNNIC